MNEIKVLGLMSGTSFDGLDLALCGFRQEKGKWKYRIIKAETQKYSEELKDKIRQAPFLSPLEFLMLHNDYGRFLGSCCNKFTDKISKPVIISSHGHTVFHRPDYGITFQLGNGAEIAAVTGITTVCDFRTQDVALKGQGAPLVPIGDELLFGDYSHCLNIGGIANISVNEKGVRRAWDICPANMALNYIANTEGKEYDENGEMARSGKVIPALLEKLNGLEYYSFRPPKSLGREWFETEFLPLINQTKETASDKLHTISKHIALQTAKSVKQKKNARILCTGGGAHNSFLISCIEDHVKDSLILPEKKVIDYKEALIFAFLGLLRIKGQVNCLKSVTGAKSDSSTGVVYESSGTL